MKMVATLILIITLPLKTLCPVFNPAFIFRAEPINYYEPLIKAIVWVESLNGKYTYNAKEQAVGWFQIRQVRVDDYNKKMGTKYVLEDFYDYELSREMFLYYTKGRNYEIVARCWNGGDKNGMNYKQTKQYWEKIKANI